MYCWPSDSNMCHRLIRILKNSTGYYIKIIGSMVKVWQSFERERERAHNLWSQKKTPNLWQRFVVYFRVLLESFTSLQRADVFCISEIGRSSLSLETNNTCTKKPRDNINILWTEKVIPKIKEMRKNHDKFFQRSKYTQYAIFSATEMDQIQLEIFLFSNGYFPNTMVGRT